MGKQAGYRRLNISLAGSARAGLAGKRDVTTRGRGEGKRHTRKAACNYYPGIISS